MENLILILLTCFGANYAEVFSNAECFVTGECVNSFSVEISTKPDQYECLDFCKGEERCTWFTFFPDSTICNLFEACNTLDTVSCPNCISGEKECQSDVPKCWIQGQCEGTIIGTQSAGTPNDCLTLCKGQSGCTWFTYIDAANTCFLFSDCKTFDETSEEGISGESRCDLIPDSTTPTVPTTITPPPVYTKVMVAVGLSLAGNDIEVIDLLSPTSRCQNLPKYPHYIGHAGGGLDFDNNPFICGGLYEGSDCYTLQDGEWRNLTFMTQKREALQITKSPFVFDGSKYFILGGSYSNTSELLTASGWQSSVEFPVHISYHCMVHINATTVMVVGGIESGSLRTLSESYILNTFNMGWVTGPELQTRRQSHSCGMIKSDSQGQQRSVVAIGGYLGDYLPSVEVLDPGSDAWRFGPELPFGIYGAAIVEDPSGGLILIGGYSYGHKGIYRDTLFKLAHVGVGASWEELPKKLQSPRAHHVAILIPDYLANCTAAV